MNAGLQCLLCTTELTHFFVRGFYKQDLNLDNPLGCKGKVAESFKLLVDQTHSHTETWAPQKNHWGVATHAVEPAHFKRAIGQFNAMFSGYDQHDSQELLGAALDGIHEDLNRVKKKPYVENVVGDGKNDTAVAQEAWDRYKMRNDSFIVDTFQGQTRSRLTCPECENMSVSFEPSMYLSVAFKQVVPPSSLRVVVKFQSPASVRPDDQVPFDELPQGFHFDCDVKVFLPAPADTFGSLVKRFEDRTSGRRFVAVTFVQQYSGAAAFSGFCLPSENVPTERKNANHYVLLEVPEFAANGWIEWDGLVSAASATVSTSSSKPAAAAQPAKSNVQNYDEAENARSDSDDSDDIVRDAAPASLSRDWKDSIAPEQSGLHALVRFVLRLLHVTCHGHLSSTIQYARTKKPLTLFRRSIFVGCSCTRHVISLKHSYTPPQRTAICCPYWWCSVRLARRRITGTKASCLGTTQLTFLITSGFKRGRASLLNWSWTR